jgi:hypothetical protein
LNAADLALRAGRKVRSLYGAARHHGKTALAPMVRDTRRLLIDAGLPIRKHFLVLPCLSGTETSGLFTEFLAALGALAQHEHWPSIYSGLRIDYADQGLYYDPAVGPNWWNYYFEPVAIGDSQNAVVKTIDPHQHDLLTYHAAAMSRATAHDLIARHVRPRPHIQRLVDAYVAEHFDQAFSIGVHYRGTDKHEEAPPVAYDEVVAAIHAAAAGAGSATVRVFLATDDQRFLDVMIERFPGRLRYRPMFRSKDGRPIDVTNDDTNYQKGEDAVVDCLLLSRTRFLIRTASNLSLCSAFFNPEVPERILNRPYYSPSSNLW